ncbi:MAG: DUF6573 family protein [Nitrospira sp.]|jgi:hypothetical protein|nr:DUF6573 family protein [Nitrospira sp.]
MTEHTHPKPLTHDEKKAADAAFAGRPFNPSWSDSARVIYEGIVTALPKTELALPSTAAADTDPVTDVLADREDTAEASSAGPGVPTIKDRQQAILSGILIDVTPTAQQLGLTFPVTITKPLWELGIVTTDSLPEEEQARRLRDVLMAFRLRLASLATISPLIDFPAILAMPPSTIPQAVPLFAIIQPDAANQANVTLLLPNEVSLSITPTN